MCGRKNKNDFNQQALSQLMAMLVDRFMTTEMVLPHRARTKRHIMQTLTLHFVDERYYFQERAI